MSTRLIAVHLLRAVLHQGVSLEGAVSANEQFSALDSRDRAFVWLVVSTCLRRLGQIDELIAHCLDHPLPKEAQRINDILRIGFTQIIFVGTPPHAAVNVMVDMVPGHLHRYRKLVNAVLRRLVREGVEWVESQDEEILNTPRWLWESWCSAYGNGLARKISAAHLIEPPLDITPKGKPDSLVGPLSAHLLPTGTLRVQSKGQVTDRPGFEKGDWWVQDVAAGLPVLLFGDVNGQEVLDLCAAPGGKTAQLLSRGAEVVAVDRSGSRLEKLRANLKRLRLNAQIVHADVNNWQPSRLSRYILLDAPCTATGTIRRHPDIMHLRGKEDLQRAIVIQDTLLDAAVRMLAPGGIIVFATCSLQVEEGKQRISSLLERHSDLIRVPINESDHECLGPFVTNDGDIQTLPAHWADLGGMDGFYAARLKRSC